MACVFLKDQGDKTYQSSVERRKACVFQGREGAKTCQREVKPRKSMFLGAIQLRNNMPNHAPRKKWHVFLQMELKNAHAKGVYIAMRHVLVEKEGEKKYEPSVFER